MQQESELSELLSTGTTQTRRAVVPELEKILYHPMKVLDHGFVRVVDYMGDDSAIVQAARVSYGKGTKKISQDRGLINYLMRHRHTTPFEMCDIKFHIKLPIFIARQWIRHRTASVNEYSGRYSILSKEFYIPSADNLAKQSKTNKQGRDDVLSQKDSERVLELLIDDSERCYTSYQEMLNEDEKGNSINSDFPGLARELARMNLTLNYYTEWYWKINLHNLMHFLALRADEHAQYEIRVYAEVMLNVLKAWVPITYDAFMEYRKNSLTLSASAVKLINALLEGKKPDLATSSLSKREMEELAAKISIPT